MADKTFPPSTLFHYPILLLLSDGQEHARSEMVQFEIEKLAISDEDQKIVTPGKNGKEGANKVSSWTSYAIADLSKAEYIAHNSNGYVITESGRAFFEKHKEGFKANDLVASKAYRKYKNKGEFSKSKKKKSATVPKPSYSNNSQIAPSSSPNTTKPAEEGVVYILTNPAFKTFYIKIGFTTNINDRLKELYNTSVPLPFKVYALLKTTKYKQAEKMIHSAFKASRIGNDREFFMLKPEEALEQMKVVAEGLDAIVIIYDDNGNEKKIIDYSK